MAARRAAFTAGPAIELARAVRPGVTAWSAGGRMPLSKLFAWFADEDALVVVGCPLERQRDLELGLAFGLAHMGDRELILVLPAGTEEPTRRRLPWLDVPVRIFTHEGGVVTAVPLLARAEVLALVNDEVVTTTHRLRERTGWVERLLQWAGSTPELVPAHRPSYLAWHCHGRMVLRIKRSRGGLTVTAGVHASAPGQVPWAEHVAGPVSPEQFHRVVAAAALAVADRLGGVDTANAEHRMQERLAAMRASLSLVGTLREFPAFRPVDNRGYIDLLGLAGDGTIHVVETKIGPDAMLVLQGLDYWVWTMAHREEVAAHLGRELGLPAVTSPRVALDFVVAAKDSTFVSPYTAAQAEALDGSIGWQFHTVEDIDTDHATVVALGRRRSPTGPRATEARFAARLEAQLIERAGPSLQRRVFYAEPAAGIVTDARPAFEGLRSRDLLHGFVGHVRSSQAFALYVFGGLGDDELMAVWGLVDDRVTRPLGTVIEYVDPQDSLGELQPARPHQTQVDVLLTGETADGSVTAALIEVKLSETGFGSCSAFDSPGNDRRDVCRSSGPWGHEPGACFQLRNHDGPTRRRYDTHLEPSWTRPAGPECPFRELNQPMRNVALARGLIDRHEIADATFVLCAPRGNANVWRQWRTAEAVFAAVPELRLVGLAAEDVMQVLGWDRRTELDARYGWTTEPTA